MVSASKVRKLAMTILITFVVTSIFACSTPKVSSEKQSENLLQEISIGPDTDQFFAASEIDILGAESVEKHLVTATLSDSSVYILTLDNQNIPYIEQYDYNGTLMDSFILDAEISPQYGSCKCFRDNNLLHLVDLAWGGFDVCSIDLNTKKASHTFQYVDPDSNESNSYIETAGFKDNTIYIKRLTLKGYNLQGFDLSSGNLVFQTEPTIDGESFFWIGDSLYASNNRSDRTLYTFDKSGKLLSDSDSIENFRFEFFQFEQRKQFFGNADGLWYVNDQGVIENLVLWASTSRNISDFPYISEFAVSESLQGILIYSDEGAVELLVPGENILEGKKVLKLACFGETMNEKLQWSIQQFNQTNDQYAVELVDYINFLDESDYLTDEGYVDYVALGHAADERIWKDVLSGDGPDMLFNLSDGSIQLDSSYINSDVYLYDLSPFWNAESEQWREQFIAPTFLVFEKYGKLMTVPTNCSVYTTAVSSEFDVDLHADFAGLLSFLKRNPEIQFLQWGAKEEFLKEILSIDLDSFINRETNTANFDNQVFRDLLDLCNSYCMTDQDMKKDFGSFQCLFESVYVSDTSSYFEYKFRSFYESQTRQKYSIMGYPTSNGASGYIRVNDTVSVTQSCKDIEGAWSFIKFLLSHDVQSYYLDRESLRNDMSVRWDSLDEQLDFFWHPEAHESYWQEEDYGDGPSSRYGYSDEEIQSFRDYLASIDHIYNPDSQIISIVLEEVAPFFAGQKSQDEVIATINNRVQVVLNERGS